MPRLGSVRGWPRALPVSLFLLGLSGCAAPEPGDDLPEPAATAAIEDTLHVDDLSSRLAPASGAFFPDLFPLDRVDLPAGGNITFSIGLGMRCDGNATGHLDVTGWLECSVRLAEDPLAVSRDRRPLGVGFDFQILSQRTATAPIQWRVELAAFDAVGNLTGSFDSGWRDLDLTPKASVATVALAVLDPCDWPDGLEDRLGKRGAAELNVSFSAQLVAANVTFAFGGSRPGQQGSASHVVRVDQSEHAAVATFPLLPTEETLWVRFPVSLETESSTPATDLGPCLGAWAHEVQEWSVTFAYAAADGTTRTDPPVLPTVDVYLAAAASP